MRKLLGIVITVILVIGMTGCSKTDDGYKEKYELLQTKYDSLQRSYDSVVNDLAEMKAKELLDSLTADTLYDTAPATSEPTPAPNKNSFEMKLVDDQTLPLEFSFIGFDGKPRTTTRVDKITYEADYHQSDNEYSLTIFFSGEKVYDAEGKDGTDPAYFDFSIENAETGVGVETKTAVCGRIKPGEKFYNAKALVFGVKPGKYIIRLSNYN